MENLMENSTHINKPHKNKLYNYILFYRFKYLKIRMIGNNHANLATDNNSLPCESYKLP